MAPTDRIQHFLLVFDHERGTLIELVEFGEDSAEATRKYAEAEEHYGDGARYEIVLVGSDSIETVKVTHANYFDGTVAMSKYLAGLVDGPALSR
jgi:hypothetical protein